ncbi:MAG: hypothetical protein U1D55_02705 [Phycisphaerae bacterium]
MLTDSVRRYPVSPVLSSAIGLFLIAFSTFFALLTLGGGIPLAARVLIGTPLAVMAALGAALLLARAERRVETEAGEAVFETRLLGWRRRRRTPLERFEHVRVDAVASSRSHRGGGGVRYAVSLEGSREDDSFPLLEDRDYLAARREGELLAAWLGLPLRDTTTPKTIETGHTDLNTTLADRLRADAAPRAWPGRGNRIRFTIHPGEVEFRLPPLTPRDRNFSLASVVLLMGASAGPAWFSLRRFNATLAACAAGGLGLFWLGGAALYLARRERLTASRRGVLLAVSFPLYTRVREIPANELEELRIVGDELRARSDREWLRFGATLTAGERRWLLKAIEFVVLNGPPIVSNSNLEDY